MAETKISEGCLHIRDRLKFLPYRSAFMFYDYFGRKILVGGVYALVWKNDDKRKFIESFETLFDKALNTDNCIILGDMNVLEPGHSPRHDDYTEWELF